MKFATYSEDEFSYIPIKKKIKVSPNRVKKYEYKAKVHVDHHKETPPEMKFREFISKVNIPYTIYQYFEPKYFIDGFVRNYEMDFAIPELKISFEINGNFHYDTKTWDLLEYYSNRKKYIQSFGWKQVDIYYQLCFNEDILKDIVLKVFNNEFDYTKDIVNRVKDYQDQREERKRIKILENIKKRKKCEDELRTTTNFDRIKELHLELERLRSGSTGSEEFTIMKTQKLEEFKKFLMNHPNYVSSEEGLNEYITQMYDKKYKLDFISELSQKLLILVQHPEIDYSKLGWGEKLGKYFNMPGNSTVRYVRKFFPKFYEDRCFRRKDPDLSKKSKPSYKEMQEQFRKDRIDKILNSGIDFTKEHWVNEVTKFLGLGCRRSTLKWLRKYMPEFCEQYLNYDYNRYPTEDTKKQGVSSWIRNRKSK